jgi:hypothetical protein
MNEKVTNGNYVVILRIVMAVYLSEISCGIIGYDTKIHTA